MESSDYQTEARNSAIVPNQPGISQRLKSCTSSLQDRCCDARYIAETGMWPPQQTQQCRTKQAHRVASAREIPKQEIKEQPTRSTIQRPLFTTRIFPAKKPVYLLGNISFPKTNSSLHQGGGGGNSLPAKYNCCVWKTRMPLALCRALSCTHMSMFKVQHAVLQKIS